MFDRERSDPDTDIEFDFFDDAPTSETSAPRETPPPRRRRRLPRRPPTGAGTPQVRLIIAIAAAILLAVILVFVVKSCREGQKRDAYRDYMSDVGRVSDQSQRIGTQLSTLITTPGIRLADLQERLGGLRGQQAQLVATAQDLDPPGPLREQDESLIEALQFRVSGLAGLATAVTQIDKGTNASAAGRELAEQAERLAASDVVYEDLFVEGSRHVLDSEGIDGVAVPDSQFLKDPDLASARSWALIVRRLTQTPASGGLHGNGIQAVKVEPGAQTLSPTQENTVTASTRLAFEVVVENTGDSQETQVPVRLTIQQSPKPVRKTQTIDIINPGETKTVVFRRLGPPSFGTRVNVQVTVEPVAGETRTANNTAQYAVIFTLG